MATDTAIRSGVDAPSNCRINSGLRTPNANSTLTSNTSESGGTRTIHLKPRAEQTAGATREQQ